MSLDPTIEEMRRLGHAAVDRALEHLAGLREVRVARRWDGATLRAAIDEPLPRVGRGIEHAMDRFFADVLPRATLVNHPRFFAYIPGPGSFAGAIGAWLAAATNPFVGTWLGGASLAQLELTTIDWLRQALRLPAGWHGLLTTGGSMANLGALAAARSRLAEGAVGTIYVSDEAHYSVAKAARVLGFADASIRTLPTDGEQRLPIEAVEHAVERDLAAGHRPMFLCASVGTTSTGAVDPLPQLADLCERHGLWFHVDGAYGGAALLVDECRADLAGVERADSLTLDPHKWLYTPFECGCLLTQREPDLRAAFAADGQYMQDVPRDEVNFFERGPELSRGARALPLWMLLQAVGIDAIADAIRTDIRHAQLACKLLDEDPRIEIVTRPRLSVFSFRVTGGEPAGRALVEALLVDGHVMLSSSRVGGAFVIRFCVANYRTTNEDIESACARVRALL